MFLVSLLHERKCLRIDLFKINCYLNVPLIHDLVSLCVELDNVCFANTQRNDSEGICLVADKQLKFMPYWWAPVYKLCLIFRCSFRIIFILIRYVATIATEAFYDEGQLKIAFKLTLLRFSAGIQAIDWATAGSHRASRPHGLFYYSAHLAGILSKTSCDTVCFNHRVRRYLKVFLGQTEISVRFVYKLFLFVDRRLVC